MNALQGMFSRMILEVTCYLASTILVEFNALSLSGVRRQYLLTVLY